MLARADPFGGEKKTQTQQTTKTTMEKEKDKERKKRQKERLWKDFKMCSIYTY